MIYSVYVVCNYVCTRLGMSVVVTVKFAHMYRSGAAKLRACRAAGRQGEIDVTRCIIDLRMIYIYVHARVHV